MVLCSLDAVPEGTKRGSPGEKGSGEKEQASSCPAPQEESKEGPSAEVKEEEGAEPADVKPSKETLASAESSKPQGEKYSPKVSPELSSALARSTTSDLGVRPACAQYHLVVRFIRTIYGFIYSSAM